MSVSSRLDCGRARAPGGGGAGPRPQGPARRPCHRQGARRRDQRAEDVRPAGAGARGHPRRGRHPPRQVPRHRDLGPAPDPAPGPRRLGALAQRPAARTSPPQPEVRPRGARHPRRRVRHGHHRDGHQEAAGHVRRPAAARRPRHRQPRARPARRRVHHRRAERHPPEGRPLPDQGRAAPPGHHRRDRQRLLRRAAARREDVAVQAVQQPLRRPSCRPCTTPSAACSATRSSAPAGWPPAS